MFTVPDAMTEVSLSWFCGFLVMLGWERREFPEMPDAPHRCGS
jgi:hypothetical protein